MTWKPLFEDQGLPLAAMGMFVVFAALVLVILFISALPRIMHCSARWLPSETGTAKPKPVDGDELTEETIAVIAAATMAVIGGAHRIVHIDRGMPGDAIWALEGRRAHHSSHVPPRKTPHS